MYNRNQNKICVAGISIVFCKFKEVFNLMSFKKRLTYES